MDFKDQIKQLGDRITKLREQISTEEATKTAFIMPFIQLLGYDVFNPLEVLPEMTCDIGTKKGEKIDYCILKEDNPIMLIECKTWSANLSLHDNQLLRYFHVSKAKFGVLTNGIEYRFYTDLEHPNRMDETPFLVVNLLDIKDAQIEELKKFHKSYFDLETIISTASELKYLGELRQKISEEFQSPSTEFVKLLGKDIYHGFFTSKVVEQFSTLVKRAISSHISDIISLRLNAAIQSEAVKEPEFPAEKEAINTTYDDCTDSGIETTEEELEAFLIIRAIIAPVIDVKRITYRDAKSYFTVIIDDNNRKLVCRLYLNSSTNKKLSYFDENKQEVIHKIDSLLDIYKYVEELKKVAAQYSD